jgi:type II secretory pathway pseudopilin PulG
MNSGIYLFPKTANDGTYVQGAAAPANGGSAGAVPTNYSAAMTTTPATYDATSVSGTATSNASPATANGAFQRVILGVDQTVTTTGTVTLPSVSLSYTEI